MSWFDLPVLATPTTEETLSYLDAAISWLLTHGILIVVILVGASVATGVGRWLVHRFFRTMIVSSTKITDVAGAVVKRDPRDQADSAKRIEQRASTLSNVAVNVLTAVIWMIAVIMVLDQLGVSIAPVIASLGVVGLAAGIGAQTVIKDFVAGVVMLFEDIVAVGDTVDLEHASGTVENINLRATQVRSADGILWTVRNGEIVRVGNMSRGYRKAIVLLDIDARADDALIEHALTSVGEALREDPDWAEDLRGEVEISGILKEDAVLVQRRIEVTTAPGRQGAVEMELRRRVRTAFSEAGIAFALPRFAATTGDPA